MMWCIHSFFQKPCFFGYQMKSLFAYQSGCKKAASSQCLLWFTSDFSPGNTDPNQQLLGQMPNCLTECDFVPPGWTVEKGCQNWEDWRFSNKKLKPGVKFLMDFFFSRFLSCRQSAIFFVGPVQVIARASKQRMAGNVPMATLEKQRSFVCLQAGGSSHGNWRVHH